MNKEKIEEIKYRFSKEFVIPTEDGGYISKDKSVKDIKDFWAKELSTLIKEERKEAVEGFITDFIETGVYEGVGSIEDIMKLWRKYNAHN